MSAEQSDRHVSRPACCAGMLIALNAVAYFVIMAAAMRIHDPTRENFDFARCGHRRGTLRAALLNANCLSRLAGIYLGWFSPPRVRSCLSCLYAIVVGR